MLSEPDVTLTDWGLAVESIGVTALAAWALGATLVWPPAVVRTVMVVAAGGFLVYAGS